MLECEFAEIQDVGVALPRLSKAHASVDNIEPSQTTTARLLYHHSADYAPARCVFTTGYCCLLSVHCMEQVLASTGDHLLAPPYVVSTIKQPNYRVFDLLYIL